MILPSRSDISEDDEEIDDQDIQKIIIVTQTPPAFKKHPGGDRTGQSYNRSKLTADIAQAINDGLYFYEQVRPFFLQLCVCVLTGEVKKGFGKITPP